MELLHKARIAAALVSVGAGMLGCGNGGGAAPNSAGSTGGTAGDPLVCNPVSGLSSPLPVCTAANPCTRPGDEVDAEVIDAPSTPPPLCRTTEPNRPVFDDGPPLAWVDPAGVTRYACLYTPPDASAVSQRPLVVWMHGGNGSADDVYNFTSIRKKAPSYNLANDPSRPGFFLVSVHGRNLHYPTETPRDGNHHDFYFRDFASPSRNPDIANVDRLIDELVAEGAVDPRQIYMMGWSNGAFFSQMYTIARQNTPSPGGNAPAAAVAFTGADPFHNTASSQSPSCQLDPYPTSQAPIFLVSRACDIVACDQDQAQRFMADGEPVAPGHIVEPWRRDLADKVMDPNVQWRIVDGFGQAVNACTSSEICTVPLAVVNHLRWPDGVADRSGIDHEPAMLEFLRDNPL